MKRGSTLMFVGALAIVGGALYLLSLSTGHSAVFSRWHLWLLVANIAVSLMLVVIIGINLFRLVRAVKKGRTGAGLTGRLVFLFTALAVLPVGAVFYFSVQFINHSIDSWFDLDLTSTLQDSLTLSRQALASETGPYAGASAQAARMLADRGPEPLQPALARLRDELGAEALAVFDSDGDLLASSSEDSKAVTEVPVPDAELAAELAAHGPSAKVYDSSGKGLYVQAYSPLTTSGGATQVFEALYPVGGQESALASRVEAAYTHYRQLNYDRGPLKLSFTLTLSLVLLLSLLAAVWAAFFAAQHVAAPLRQLVGATRAVARGDFAVKVPEQGRDEIGILARSFNTMTQGLTEAREEARRGQDALEHERTWLATVLGALSSGVVTLDEERRLRIINAAAARVLGIDAAKWMGRPLEEFLGVHAEFGPLFRPDGATMGTPYDVRLHLPNGDRTLRAAITQLASLVSEAAGYVWIFEDVTEFIAAQREAAWGEVARRLAHEIKNPLMPIQLAAERLRMKCLPLLSGREAEILDRSTSTVIAQVQAMQAMVDAFSEYAKSPPLHLSSVDLGEIVREIAELYRGRPGLNLSVDVPPSLGPVSADPSRLRQILHNLVKNAVEAQEERVGWARVWIRAEPALEDSNLLVLRVRDAGPGFHPDVLAHAFEPYVTSKHKGTGLGLALVRKLAEEQGGTVNLANVPDGGAEVTVTIPRSRPPSLRVLRGGAS